MGISFYWLSEHVTGLQRCLFASTGRRVVIAFNVQAKSRCSPQPIGRIRNKMSITFGPDLWDLPGLGAISIGIGPRAAICTSILGSTRRFGCNRFGTSSSRTIYGRTLIAFEFFKIFKLVRGRMFEWVKGTETELHHSSFSHFWLCGVSLWKTFRGSCLIWIAENIAEDYNSITC